METPSHRLRLVVIVANGRTCANYINLVATEVLVFFGGKGLPGRIDFDSQAVEFGFGVGEFCAQGEIKSFPRFETAIEYLNSPNSVLAHGHGNPRAYETISRSGIDH